MIKKYWLYIVLVVAIVVLLCLVSYYETIYKKQISRKYDLIYCTSNAETKEQTDWSKLCRNGNKCSLPKAKAYDFEHQFGVDLDTCLGNFFQN